MIGSPGVGTGSMLMTLMRAIRTLVCQNGSMKFGVKEKSYYVSRLTSVLTLKVVNFLKAFATLALITPFCIYTSTVSRTMMVT